MTDRTAFLAALIGRPYRIGGRGPEAYDCYGLVRHVLRELGGRDMPDIAFERPTTRAVAEAMILHPERAHWDEVDLPRPLDLVLMGNVLKRDFHLGIFVAPSTVGVVLHADDTNGVVAADIPALQASGFNYLRFFRAR